MQNKMDFYEEVFIVIAYFFAVLAGAGLLLWHCFNWLKSGFWAPIPARSAFDYFDMNLAFIFNPTEWFGLAKILRWLLELPLFIIGPVVVVLTAHALRRFSRSQRQK